MSPTTFDGCRIVAAEATAAYAAITAVLHNQDMPGTLMGFAPVRDPVVSGIVLAHGVRGQEVGQYITWYYSAYSDAVFEGEYYPYDNAVQAEISYECAVRSFVRRTLRYNRITYP